mmetsp:Transcript_20158/g.56156  ORF Transcript_20158/g.56156 Transcript_20158/m.56156 type:complete len:471 (-) Transcript_20158:290-1702(-)
MRYSTSFCRMPVAGVPCVSCSVFNFTVPHLVNRLMCVYVWFLIPKNDCPADTHCLLHDSGIVRQSWRLHHALDGVESADDLGKARIPARTLSAGTMCADVFVQVDVELGSCRTSCESHRPWVMREVWVVFLEVERLETGFFVPLEDGFACGVGELGSWPGLHDVRDVDVEAVGLEELLVDLFQEPVDGVRHHVERCGFNYEEARLSTSLLHMLVEGKFDFHTVWAWSVFGNRCALGQFLNAILQMQGHAIQFFNTTIQMRRVGMHDLDLLVVVIVVVGMFPCFVDLPLHGIPEFLQLTVRMSPRIIERMLGSSEFATQRHGRGLQFLMIAIQRGKLLRPVLRDGFDLFSLQLRLVLDHEDVLDVEVAATGHGTGREEDEEKDGDDRAAAAVLAGVAIAGADVDGNVRHGSLHVRCLRCCVVGVMALLALVVSVGLGRRCVLALAVVVLVLRLVRTSLHLCRFQCASTNLC